MEELVALPFSISSPRITHSAIPYNPAYISTIQMTPSKAPSALHVSKSNSLGFGALLQLLHSAPRCSQAHFLSLPSRPFHLNHCWMVSSQPLSDRFFMLPPRPSHFFTHTLFLGNVTYSLILFTICEDNSFLCAKPHILKYYTGPIKHVYKQVQPGGPWSVSPGTVHACL